MDSVAETTVVELNLQKRARYSELCDPITLEISRKKKLHELGTLDYSDEQQLSDLQLLHEQSIIVDAEFAVVTKKARATVTNNKRPLTPVKRIYNIKAIRRISITSLIIGVTGLISLILTILIN
jgi:hypothetical protein